VDQKRKTFVLHIRFLAHKKIRLLISRQKFALKPDGIFNKMILQQAKFCRSVNKNKRFSELV
jgi:hypothetical protein